MAEPRSIEHSRQPHAGTSAANWALSGYTDYYLIVLGVLLAGYAIGGKAFAYISIPPVYIGDLVLAFGVIAFLKSRCAVATLATLPSLILVFLLGWAATRLLPFFGEYGFDALRDSIIVFYCVFALIVVALLLEKPERLRLIIPFIGLVGSIVILTAPVLQVMRFILDSNDAWGSPESLLLSSPAEVSACHLTGAGLLMLLGFRRVRAAWLGLLLFGMALISMGNRGSLAAMVVPIVVAAVIAGRLRQLAVVSAAVIGLMGLAYALNLSVLNDSGSGREVSAEQLVENVTSIVDPSDTKGNLASTREWRLQFWNTILNYTFDGSYFWTGKGFGINLAEDAGFMVGDPSAPPLRAPHSAHLSMLARTGVPGLTLWLLSFGVWIIMLLVNMAHARARGDNSWGDFFVFILCYALAFLISGSFSTGLEGPMLSIWLWSLFGVGIGATMIYRAPLRN